MKFVAPEMEISFFSTEDVITASQNNNHYYETTTTMSGSADCPAELPMD